MIREQRYFVIKIKDVDQYLSTMEMVTLEAIMDHIDHGRHQDNKPRLTAVVVEQDWPEYEIVWKMLEERVNGTESGS